ncbi:MAG: hypothetical protein QM820_39580 [Minicystis sp.]
MLPIVAPPPCGLVLYDPTGVSFTGWTGQEEANAVAARRDIPAGNVHPLPHVGCTPYLRSVVHNGNVIIITHGNESTGFTTATLRSDPSRRVGADVMVCLLATAGLFANRSLPYRFELVICGSASGHDTFAARFHREVASRVPDVIVKAPVGLAEVSAGGEVSVTYFHLASRTYADPLYAMARTLGWAAMTPARALSNRFSRVPDTFVTRNNVLLHDWVYYPAGQSF